MKRIIFSSVSMALVLAIASPALAQKKGPTDKEIHPHNTHTLNETYDEFKKRLEEDHGLTFDGAVSILGQHGSPNGKITPWQVQWYGEANWNAFQSKWGDGSFQVSYTKVRYWGRTGDELDSNLGVASDVNDYSSNHNYFTQLTYTHKLPGVMDWMSVSIGQFPMYLFDGNPYMSNQQTDFNNLAFSQNGTYSYPSASMGAFVTMAPNEEWTGVVGFQDANEVGGRKMNFSTFNDGNYTTFASLAYTPNIEGLGKGKYAILVYNQPKVDEQPETSYGWSLNLSQDLGEKWAIFGRLNGVDKSANLKQSYVAGVVYKDPLERNNSLDKIGFAGGINKINKDALGDDARKSESVFELYWDVGFLDHFIITPDVQFYVKPALNPKTDTATVFSIRATLLF